VRGGGEPFGPGRNGWSAVRLEGPGGGELVRCLLFASSKEVRKKGQGRKKRRETNLVVPPVGPEVRLLLQYDRRTSRTGETADPSLFVVEMVSPPAPRFVGRKVRTLRSSASAVYSLS
jgi:hypothetical protein